MIGKGIQKGVSSWLTYNRKIQGAKLRIFPSERPEDWCRMAG